MSVEKLNRNFDIFAKYRNGLSYLEIAKLYGLSTARVRQIVDKVSYDIRHPVDDILEIKVACENLEAPKWMNGRIQEALRKKKLSLQNRWRRLSRDEILSIPSIGNLAADILEYAQKL